MTVTAIDTYQSAALAIRPGQEMWTDKQKAALAVLGIRGASSADLAVFMHYCQKTGLDPFSKQIYMICRREKQGDQWVDRWTIQVGIEGFRVIRDRVAERLGIEVEYEDTVWYDHDGSEHKIWLRNTPPAGCTVVVLKNGRRYPGTLRFSEYVQTRGNEPTGRWRDAPAHQIEKCSEAFALRRAFPHDLGGIYLEDEMPQQEPGAPAVIRSNGKVTAADVIDRQPAASAGGPAVDEAPVAGTPPAGPAEPPAEVLVPSTEPGSAQPQQVGRLQSLYQGLGFTRSEAEQVLRASEKITGRELTGPRDGRTLANLSAHEASRLIDTLDGLDRGGLTARLAEADAARAGEEAPDQ
jgi:phage recombination protein Bet